MSNDSNWVAADTALIDLQFQRVPQVIASYLLPTNDGLALVECGPGSTIDRLHAAVRTLGHDPSDIRHILVTHIHLDHAGAAGSLLRELPRARLYVHEVGAPHLVDPSKLIASATRIYGEMMDTLWGDLLPVPAERITVLADGDRLDIGGRQLDVLYTPGHASHHVAYHEPERGIIFAGDVAGNTIPPARAAVPATPPPDIDVPLWHQSVQRLRELDAELMLIAHFGAIRSVAEHLHDLDTRLDDVTARVASWVRQGIERDDMVDRMTAYIREQVLATGGNGSEEAMTLAAPAAMSLDGLTRYLRKRAEQAPDS
jgi:glyoxylase-like metal-dependent hydrolase (beta-lactamase superfamily II)